MVPPSAARRQSPAPGGPGLATIGGEDRGLALSRSAASFADSFTGHVAGMETVELELLRRGYAAVGLGAPPDLLRLFDQGGEERDDPDMGGRADEDEGPHAPPPDAGHTSARWCVQMLDSGTRYPAREVVADDLFGAVPPHWEVTGVEVECLLPYEMTDGTLRVVARGTYRCRPRGSWECYDLPFAHVWTFRGGHVQRVVCYLEGVELRRLAG